MRVNNEELAAVCEGHVGKPWWPDGLAYHDDLNQWLADEDIADTVNESHHFKIKLEPDAAADMILGAAVRWLAEQDDTMLGPPTSAGGKYYVGLRNSAAKEGDTLLAAVLSACKDVEAA